MREVGTTVKGNLGSCQVRTEQVGTAERGPSSRVQLGKLFDSFQERQDQVVLSCFTQEIPTFPMLVAGLNIWVGTREGPSNCAAPTPLAPEKAYSELSLPVPHLWAYLAGHISDGQKSFTHR